MTRPAETDPFEALREPIRPADPGPGFARRLRQRLTREVFASTGGDMTQPTSAVDRCPACQRPAAHDGITRATRSAATPTASQ